jgi:hypothetical protein
MPFSAARSLGSLISAGAVVVSLMAKLDALQKNFPKRADYGFFPSAVQAYFVKNFTSSGIGTKNGVQMLISQLKDRDCVSLGICVCVAQSR